MTIAYDVQINREQLANALELFEFIGGNADDALRVAINKTAPKIKTASSRAIRTQVRLAASYVGGKLQVVKATRKKLTASIWAESRGILMPRYATNAAIAGAESNSWMSAPQVPTSGIRVKVKASGSAKTFVGTESNKPFFMVLRKSQSLGIVARRDSPGKRGGKIKVYHGPSVSQVFDTVRADVLPEAQRELQAQMVDAIRYLTLKLQPSEGAGA